MSACRECCKVRWSRYSVRNWCCQCAAWGLRYNRNHVTAGKSSQSWFKQNMPVDTEHAHKLSELARFPLYLASYFFDLPSLFSTIVCILSSQSKTFRVVLCIMLYHVFLWLTIAGSDHFSHCVMLIPLLSIITSVKCIVIHVMYTVQSLFIVTFSACSSWWVTEVSGVCVSQIASTHGSDDDDLGHRQPDD